MSHREIKNMRVCQSCGSKHADGTAPVCFSCSAPLWVRCPACQEINAPTHRFCQQCAAPLNIGTAQQPSLIGREAERRQLTIMFCDLVGSTALSGHLDPEELREIVQAYQEVCANAIDHVQGYIAQYLGDGILAYFGYPQSHEDAPLRAIQVVQQILAAVALLNEWLRTEKELEIAVRIGIHTGLTVIGDIGTGAKRERLALGETPNIAARIEGLAEPNQIAVSASTFRLASKYFTFEHVGTYPLKGLSQPMDVYRPLVEKIEGLGAEKDPEAWIFVGRKTEYASLQSLWEQARTGAESLALVHGGPGIGKSQLLQAFVRSIDGETGQVLAARCSRHHTTKSFFPITDLFRRSLDLLGDRKTSTRLERLEKYLAAFGFPLAETVPLFAQVFHIAPGEAYSPPAMSARQIRRRIFAIMREIADRMAAQRPLLFIVEDLQWADSDTRELLEDLWKNRKDSRILFLFTFRPEFSHDWTGEHVHSLPVGPLDTGEIVELANQLAGGKKLPDGIVDQLLRRTDGNPLFLEEVMRNMLESGLLKELPDRFELTGSLSDLTIPSSLKDLLSSRLDQLGDAREIAQIAAVFGRQFSVEVIQAVSGLEQGMINANLLRLIESGLLNQEENDPESLFAFRHVLVQEEAYELLLKRKRQEYHLRIARALEHEFPEFARLHPGFIAHHYSIGGDIGRAVPAWLSAGQAALRESDYGEAIIYFEKGLSQLSELPEGKDRDTWELGLQAGLALALLTTRGYSGPGVEQAYARAYDLAQKTEEQPHVAAILRGLWSLYTVKGNHYKAAGLAKKLAKITAGTSDALLRFEVAKAVGGTEMWRGHFKEARRDLEQALQGFDPDQWLGHAQVHSEHPAVACLAYLGYAQILMGQAGLGLASQQQACDFAARRAHPFSQVYSLSFKALAHMFLCDPALTASHARSALALADRHDFGFWQLFNRVLLNWCDYESQSDLTHFARFQESIAAFRDLGASLWISHPLTLVAEGLGRQNRATEGMEVLDEVDAMLARDGERFYEAETARVRGELLARIGAQEKARQAFQQAMEHARRQGAVLFSLRCAMAMGKQVEADGDTRIAREMLRKAWNHLDEEMRALPDGKAAKQLLESWGGLP